MTPIVEAAAPVSLDALAARVRCSSNVRFSWQGFSLVGAQPTATSYRLDLCARHAQTPAGVTRGASARLERRDSEASKTVPERSPSASAPIRLQGVTWSPLLNRCFTGGRFAPADAVP